MKDKNKIVRFFSENVWSWALIGSLVMWLIISTISGKISFASLNANIYTAAFIGLLSIAQMIVVTTGHGAMDLSIPGLVTLSAFLQVTIINGDPSKVPLGLIVIICTGITVGLINGCCVVFLKIPPMIATMAVNYIITSVSLIINKMNGVQNLTQVPFLKTLALGKAAGIYCAIYIELVFAALIWFLLVRTTYGKSLIAMGQNDISAYFAGINTTAIQLLSYVFASVLVALTGLLISVRVSGAFLGMGDDYLMLTVGSVVLGGTLMSGGKSSVPGTAIGAIFLTIIVTAMQIAKLDGGIQNMVQGILIILIIIIATPSRKKSQQI